MDARFVIRGICEMLSRNGHCIALSHFCSCLLSHLTFASPCLFFRALIGGTADIQVSTLPATDRRRVLRILRLTLDRLVAAAPGAASPFDASEFLYGFLGAVEGETNPQNLDIIFRMWPKIVKGMDCTGKEREAGPFWAGQL